MPGMVAPLVEPRNTSDYGALDQRENVCVWLEDARGPSIVFVIGRHRFGD